MEKEQAIMGAPDTSPEPRPCGEGKLPRGSPIQEETCRVSNPQGRSGREVLQGEEIARPGDQGEEAPGQPGPHG